MVNWEYFVILVSTCTANFKAINIFQKKKIKGHSITVPYSARAVVGKQIDQMMEDGILKLSDTSFVNPLTIVYRENTELHVCIDARRVNNVMLPDEQERRR